MNAQKMLVNKAHLGFLISAFGILSLSAFDARAALTEISNTPIATSTTSQVPPNIFYVLDDSRSMLWAHMSDSMRTMRTLVGYKNHVCNGLYYNPSKTYDLPVNADGTVFGSSGSPFTAPVWPEAWYNGFDQSEGKVNVNTSFKAYDLITGDNINQGGLDDTPQPAYYYKWNGASPPGANNCDDALNALNANWEKVVITDASPAAEKQNFVNWFSYYRTRMLLMKAASGRAFTQLDDNFRVGFITICPGSGSGTCGSVGTSRFLPIAKFDASQKSNWYSKLYSQEPNSGTPLRQALARAGRYYANVQTGINAGITDDPVQYSCQKNFTLLTTDGNWNSSGGVKLDGNSVGNQDSDISLDPRPMYDGGPVSVEVKKTQTRTVYETRGGNPSCSNPKPKRAKITVQTRVVTTTTPQVGSASTDTPSWSNVSVTNDCVENAMVLNPPTVVGPIVTNETTNHVGTGFESNTLADVASYYYNTDLRPNGSIGALGTDVGTGGEGKDVSASGSGVEDDKATHQHMTTFTLGLGVSGQLTFDPNYKSATTGDFQDIRNGTKGWPKTDPADDSPSDSEALARIDDLWHAAVNGRGMAFSASDADTLSLSLQKMLTQIQVQTGSAAAAATSSLTPTTTNNLILEPEYRTGDWIGDLRAKQIDLTLLDAQGQPNPNYGKVIPTERWAAAAKLDATVKPSCDGRTIKLYRSSATDKLVDFAWNTSKCDGAGVPLTATTSLDSTEQAFFSAAQVGQLSHYALMTDGTDGVDQKTPAAGAKLVNFIRGQRGFEGFEPNNANTLYRSRVSVLGDIVHSQPVFVGASALLYKDTGYDAFKLATATRTPMIYVGANDGMLHAFTAGSNASNYTDGGVEKWAFIPRTVLPNLFKMADVGWSTKHEYYVDSKPIVGDIFDGTNWKTILVGGLRKGGRGYYALDITNPDQPKALWEFTHNAATCYSGSGTYYSDCHLGYSFALPIITKLSDGTWVVVVTSGYNNVNTPTTTGDGRGYLYVLNAATGQILKKIDSGVGDATTPSGLSNTRSWTNAEAAVDATTSVIYGADLLGNLFRFDINNASPSAFLITTLKDPSGTPQPVTTRLVLAEVGSPPKPYIFAGTGQYLGPSDAASKQIQTLYAIKDTGASIADPRTALIKNVITIQGGSRYIGCDTNCASSSGWYVDLPAEGERISIDMQAQFGVLTVGSNIPTNTACSPGGTSAIMGFAMDSGLSPYGLGEPIGYSFSSMLVGITIVKLPNDQGQGYARGSDGKTYEFKPPTLLGGKGKRMSWREIVK